MPVQIKSLSRPSEQEIDVGEAVRRLRLAYPVADLTPDRERPLDVTDPFGIADIAQGVAEVVQDPRLTLTAARLAGAVQRDAVGRDAVRPVAPAVEEEEQRGG